MLPEQDGENSAVLIVSGIRFRIWNHEGGGMDHRMWLLPVRWAPQGAFISSGEELAVVVTVSKESRLSRERLVSYLFYDLILMQNSLIVEIIYVIKRKRLTVTKMCAHSVEETAQHALPEQTQLCSHGAFMASVTCSPQHSPIASLASSRWTTASDKGMAGKADSVKILQRLWKLPFMGKTWRPGGTFVRCDGHEGREKWARPSYKARATGSSASNLHTF